MTERTILGLTGLSGTGKSTISEYLIQQHGFTVLEGSPVLKSVAAEEGVTLSERADYEQFFREQQRLRGMDWLSRMVIDTAGDRVMQGGLRSRYDFATIRRNGGFIIGLACPPEICIQRVDSSNPKNPTTLEAYAAQVALEESTDEYGLHTAWCVANADYVFDTSKPLDATKSEIDEVIEVLTR